jgi:hypothetical protein
MIGGTSANSRPTTAKKMFASPKVLKKSPKILTEESPIDVTKLCDLMYLLLYPEKKLSPNKKNVKPKESTLRLKDSNAKSKN